MEKLKGLQQPFVMPLLLGYVNSNVINSVWKRVHHGGVSLSHWVMQILVMPLPPPQFFSWPHGRPASR